jgi:hypothetical protein
LGVIVCSHGKSEEEACRCGYDYNAAREWVNSEKVVYDSGESSELIGGFVSISSRMVAKLDTTNYLSGDIIDAYLNEAVRLASGRDGVQYIQTHLSGSYLNDIETGTKSYKELSTKILKIDPDILTRNFVLFPLHRPQNHFGLAAVAYPRLVVNGDSTKRPCIIFMDPFKPAILDVSIIPRRIYVYF